VTSLEVEGAIKSYGATRALDGLGLRLEEGEWVALLGPNGAGKTTLLGAVAGLVALDDGTVEVLGERLDPRRPRAHEALGLVPQELALYGALTARENLAAFGRLHGVRGRELRRRIGWALGWTRLADRADEPVERFSGGMKRRLNVACGVLHRPRVVLLDEPTVGVDPQSRHRIREMLEELRRAGSTLLQSTHQLGEIESICDRVLIVDHGRILADGTVEELVERTLGSDRSVRVVLDRPAADLATDLALGNGFRVSGAEVTGTVHDVAGELEALLGAVRAAGLRLRDLRVTAPGLEEVFTHLTGRELRE